jgi:exonuclease III
MERNEGGVGLLIRNYITNLVEEHETKNNDSSEIKWIKLRGKTNIAIGVIYGKQETTRKEEVETQFQELATQTNILKKTHQIIIMGDFNATINIDIPKC